MDTTAFQRLSALFLELRGCDIDDVESALAGLDASEPDVASELRRMLDADADKTAIDGLTEVFELYRSAILPQTADAPRPAIHVGQYRLMHQIGSGAHGDVWLAEQDEPVRRRVAIKLLRRSLARGLNDGRFRRELAALERLAHPGIARLLDAGVADDGTPYLVVEHVAGEPLTEFAGCHQLDADQRVTLMVAACKAIAHAHRNGIIHRDLKPSNMLASERDDGGFGLSIIDFGIAKVRGDQYARNPAETIRFEGSWAYASPEQRGLIDDWADTRSDIYSLGVVLYELLTGGPVFTHDASGSSSRPVTIDDFWRAESLRPSACLLPALAVDRRRVKDELDWVVARCLCVKPGERYPSVDSLGADLQRWLDRESVTARPPTLGYTLRKQARRRPAVVAGSAVASAGLVAVAVIMAIAVVRIGAERDRAVEAEANEAEARRIAEAVGGFVIDRLDQRNTANRGINTTVAEVFAETYDLIESEYAEAPMIAIELHRVAGDTLLMYGDADRALPHYQRRLDLVEREFGPDSAQMVSALSGVSVSHFELGNTQASREADVRAAEIAERALPPDHPSRLIAQERLVTHMMREGRTAEALDIQRSVVDTFERAQPGTMNLAKARLALGVHLRATGDPIAARAPLEKAVRELEKLNPNHQSRLEALNALGAVYNDLGNPAAAALVYGDLVPLVDEYFGVQSSPAAIARANLASSLEASGSHERALEVRESLSETVVTIFEEASPVRLAIQIRHARLLALLGHDTAARESLSDIERVLEQVDPKTLSEAACRALEDTRGLLTN